LIRWLTGGLALVQSYGFARFVESVPGAVAHPGFGFLAKTMAVLTAGTMGVMLLSERLMRSPDDEPIETDGAPPSSEVDAVPAEATVPELDAVAERLLTAGDLLNAPLHAQPRERVKVPRQRNDDDGSRG
jgi:hypothetical protein